MKNKGLIRITIDFDSPVQSEEESNVAIIKTLLEWIRNEFFTMCTSKGAELPFEFDDEDKEDQL